MRESQRDSLQRVIRHDIGLILKQHLLDIVLCGVHMRKQQGARQSRVLLAPVHTPASSAHLTWVPPAQHLRGEPARERAARHKRARLECARTSIYRAGRSEILLVLHRQLEAKSVAVHSVGVL